MAARCVSGELPRASQQHCQATIDGLHDVDKGWIAEVKKREQHGVAGTTLMMPRVLFEGWTGQDFSQLIGSDKKRAAAGKLVVSTCQARAADACVW